MHHTTRRWAGLVLLSSGWLFAGACVVPEALKAIFMALAFVDALA